MALLMTPISFPLALFSWKAITITELAWLFFLGFASNQAQFAMTNAYSNADLNIVQPFDFSRMIFVTIMGYIFFNEVLSIHSIIGSIVIFVSSLYIIRNRQKFRHLSVVFFKAKV